MTICCYKVLRSLAQPILSLESDQKVADIGNFIFDSCLRDEDYKAICEDEIVKTPAKCYALAQVE